MWADNLKVVLVAGVIVAHATIAWTGVGDWVLTEPPVREPLFSVPVLASGVGPLFGMALFFLLAGMFTPASLERKGLRRFMTDRLVRLGVPLLVFVVLLAPFAEYVDADNADWDQGFWALSVHAVWWSWPLPPAWGPTWFLAVLLAFSALYALGRAVRPRPAAAAGRPSGWYLVALAVVVAVTTFVIRVRVPPGIHVHVVAALLVERADLLRPAVGRTVRRRLDVDVTPDSDRPDRLDRVVDVAVDRGRLTLRSRGLVLGPPRPARVRRIVERGDDR